MVTLTRDGRLFVGDSATSLEGLSAAVAAATGGGDPAAQRIHLRGDKGALYGKVVGVMNTLTAAGYDKVALVGEEL